MQTFKCAKLNITKGRPMSGNTSSESDSPASEALELGAMTREREEDPEDTQTGRDSVQASNKSQADNSKKDVKPKSNIFFKLSIYIFTFTNTLNKRHVL